MSERESKSKNVVRTTLGGVNERAPILQPHEHHSLFGTFPAVAGLQQRIFGKRLHAKYPNPVWGIYQFWTPYGYGGGLFKLGDGIHIGDWEIPDVSLIIPDLPGDLPHDWVGYTCPDGTPYVDYVYDGDSQGIFYAIGAAAHTAPWKNPHTAGLLTFSASSAIIGQLANLVDHTSSEVAIKYFKPGFHWFKVDMGAASATSVYKVSVKAGAYDLAFKLQGCNNDKDWDNYSDLTIVLAGTWETLTVATEAGTLPCRYWRLFSPTPNLHFAVAEWEMYGHSICHFPLNNIPGTGDPVIDGGSGDPTRTGGGGGGPDPAPVEVIKGFELVLEKWRNTAATHVIAGELDAPSTPPPVPLGGPAPMPDPFAGVQVPKDGSFIAHALQYSGQSVGPYTPGVGFHFTQYQDAYGTNEGISLDLAQINLTKMIKFELEVLYEGSGVPPLTSRANLTPSFSATIKGSDVLGDIGIALGVNYTNGYDRYNRVTVTGFVITYQF